MIRVRSLGFVCVRSPEDSTRKETTMADVEDKSKEVAGKVVEFGQTNVGRWALVGVFVLGAIGGAIFVLWLKGC